MRKNNVERREAKRKRFIRLLRTLGRYNKSFTLEETPYINNYRLLRLRIISAAFDNSCIVCKRKIEEKDFYGEMIYNRPDAEHKTHKFVHHHACLACSLMYILQEDICNSPKLDVYLVNSFISVLNELGVTRPEDVVRQIDMSNKPDNIKLYVDIMNFQQYHRKYAPVDSIILETVEVFDAASIDALGDLKDLLEIDDDEEGTKII